MATSALISALLLGLSQVPAGQDASEKTAAPDVVLLRPEEFAETNKAFLEGKLDPTKLFVLKAKSPRVALYGRVAEHARFQSKQVQLVSALLSARPGTAWSAETRAAMREAMDMSPFRQAVRKHAQSGEEMTFKLVLTPNVHFSVDGRTVFLPLSSAKSSEEFDLPAQELRLTDLPERAPDMFMRPAQYLNSIACLVSPTVPAVDRLPLMQSALKALAAVDAEERKALERFTPPSGKPGLTPEEANEALAYLRDQFMNLGFSSVQEAIDAFRRASPQKGQSLSINVRANAADGAKNFGWSILGL